jgi:hypothetical protein
VEKNNTNCDCFIGFLSGEEVNKSSFKEEVNKIVYFQPELKKYGLLKGEPQTAKQIVDNRKGYLSRFKYCPYCGKIIDWKSIIGEII